MDSIFEYNPEDIIKPRNMKWEKCNIHEHPIELLSVDNECIAHLDLNNYSWQAKSHFSCEKYKSIQDAKNSIYEYFAKNKLYGFIFNHDSVSYLVTLYQGEINDPLDTAYFYKDCHKALIAYNDLKRVFYNKINIKMVNIFLHSMDKEGNYTLLERS
jgi:hypothetical protein